MPLHTENGSGYFSFAEDSVNLLFHDKMDGRYLKVDLARSEMIELRNFLNREFPPEITK